MNGELLIDSRSDLDLLLLNIEASVKVSERTDFFGWMQGVFQGVIRHEMLVCGVVDPASRRYRLDWFASAPVSERMREELCAPGAGLIYRMFPLWELAGRRALFVSGDSTGASDLSLTREIRRLALENVLIHGIPDFDGHANAFFCFHRVSGGMRDPRIALDLMAPQIYSAWMRVCSGGKPKNAQSGMAMRQILTGREVEVLNWVEQGKSNNEIAQILSISHLTVKNHVQKILRKLNVQNRAQAVSRAISLNITNRR